MSTREFMLGNVAIARGIIEGGGQVIAGYPGTPSSEIIDTLAAMEKRDFYVEWSVNEKVAFEVAAGAAIAGARSVVTMKHVGLNVASDPLMTLSYTGVKGAMIIISADDPSCHSSQNEQDTRKYAQFALMPCFDPSTPQEAKDMVPDAFRLSNKFQTAVIFRPTTRISHGKSDVELGKVSYDKPQIKFEKIPERWIMMPKNARVRHPYVLKIFEDIRKELETSLWNELEIREGSKIAVISSGVASVYAKEAMGILGLDASFLKICTYPVPENKVISTLKHADTVLVIEELEPVVEDDVRIMAQKQGLGTKILGKSEGLVPRHGELNVDICMEAISKAFGLDTVPPVIPKVDLELPTRPPVLCPGCSHRAAFYVMKKVFGKDGIYPSDIGCYTLGVQSGAVDTTLCMGASITVSSGIYHAGEEHPICCTIGDSTFFHTGMNGLLNAVYNKADITVAIMDNRITAMTGHQPNPGMGGTAVGESTVAVSISDICRALGAEFVEETDPYDLTSTEDVFRRARDHKGTSVVIAKQPCVIDLRRSGAIKSSFSVDEEKCTGCKACVKFGCPATEFDTELKRARINNMCTGCGVCIQICKFGAILEVKR
ncbi:indolepyruvate ferredoxin oxidoreductase subunit alpha [Methanomethylovorans sp.]|uniref:indolepyruvate ferredoxin oxidoreductase subunit alpha n=1 Tax=Methanomethylovorans sp. TaxID=2758717 RepID=UPI000A8C99E9|nr:indolepyruvate ferredoxin oxidoreductase subunit alpha [Methanomethylovorans sp.]